MKVTTLKIGIIETGKPSATLLKKYGDYPDMFEKLVGPSLPLATFFAVRVIEGEQIGAAETADGWMITGSRHGAYNDLPWIKNLEKFVRECFTKQIPLIGVCFGHQIMAQAMGGNVQKSNNGWEIGPKEYQLTNIPSWMNNLRSHYVSHAVHQDQILKTPPNTTIISSSKFCKYAGLIYGDVDRPTALSIQSHPELSAEFVRDLGAERLARVIDPDVLAAGFSNLGTAVNNSDWGKTFAQYFQRMVTTAR